MTQREPFKHAVEALMFLFDPERVICDRSPASRMGDRRRGDPGPLSGLDGAATAASAQAMLKGRLTTAQLAVLACRYAPPKLRCGCGSDCCSGWATNPQWQNAISYVAQEARMCAFRGVDVVYLRFITAVLRREYGKEKGALTDIGTDLGMALGTCTNHRRRVIDWLLRSERPCEDRGDDKPSLPPGIEVVAYKTAEEVLRSGGFIE